MYYRAIKLGPISTSKAEILDLVKSWIAISVAFSVLFTGGIALSSKFVNAFIISTITVGLGFLLHEFAHKAVAQYYGCFAEFRAFNEMLILAIVMSFFGVIFAAPGAVFISGHVGRRRNGHISAAGPLTNLILAMLFLSIGLFIKSGFIWGYGFMINSWLALFNMIPFWNFDGAKILKWNKIVYGAMLAIAFIFMLMIQWV